MAYFFCLNKLVQFEILLYKMFSKLKLNFNLQNVFKVETNHMTEIPHILAQ